MCLNALTCIPIYANLCNCINCYCQLVANIHCMSTFYYDMYLCLFARQLIDWRLLLCVFGAFFQKSVRFYNVWIIMTRTYAFLQGNSSIGAFYYVYLMLSCRKWFHFYNASIIITCTYAFLQGNSSIGAFYYVYLEPSCRKGDAFIMYLLWHVLVPFCRATHRSALSIGCSCYLIAEKGTLL